MQKIRVVFFGTSTFAIPSLEKLFKEPDMELVAVITQPDKPAGRGKKITPPPVKKKAIELGLESIVFQPSRIRNEEFYNFFRSLNPDVAVVVAYGKLIPKEVFDFPKYKTLNLHASLLPKYRGAAPIHRAIMAGEKITGKTIC
jgi:methionyl-tRNA formyltransferase